MPSPEDHWEARNESRHLAGQRGCLLGCGGGGRGVLGRSGSRSSLGGKVAAGSPGRSMAGTTGGGSGRLLLLLVRTSTPGPRQPPHVRAAPPALPRMLWLASCSLPVLVLLGRALQAVSPRSVSQRPQAARAGPDPVSSAQMGTLNEAQRLSRPPQLTQRALQELGTSALCQTHRSNADLCPCGPRRGVPSVAGVGSRGISVASLYLFVIHFVIRVCDFFKSSIVKSIDSKE